ncbi:transcriptional regulator, TetR family protein [Streptomyces bingchenggensis BCW-1]|uniref:Transcriptional regulator, TetR family protein n=1 Tax=Streptomyces bingchenggensis (strain BCW-1) TaxID=749414 RepID=D7BW68_STRBB|nr:MULTISPECIES: TetR/AcrR family transcriptional regulator [Streptomyces]ADI11778.1 transcriptional regulator, TetR family protein [Streptomyces bingchenggensis BCW-1]
MVSENDDPMAAALISAAVRVIAAKGYHGTSVRDIAVEAGLSVGSVYNSFGSKYELLLVIMNRAMDHLVTTTEDALFHAGTDPADRLRAIVGAHVGTHTAGPLESLIGNSELRSLDPAELRLVTAKRDVQQRMFDRVTADGVTCGVFKTPSPKETALFVVTACTSVATWFRPDGALSAEEVVRRYQEIALSAVGHVPEGHTT